MFQIVLRSAIDGRILSVWRVRSGWFAGQPTTFVTRAEAEKELDALRQAQAANIPRIFIEPVTR